MIPAELAASFSRGARARGEQYVAGGKISLTSTDSLRVEAVAQGSSAWRVTLDASGDEALRMSCTCPFAWDRGFCKHLWGTLRMADQKGLLKPLLAAADGEFVDVSGDDERYDDAADSNQFAVAREVLDPDFASPGIPAAPTASRSRDFQQPPSWRQIIDAIKHQARYEPRQPVTAEWPNDRRLIYLVDLAATTAAEGLVIELATEKLGSDGIWGAPKLFRSSWDVWHSVPDPIDREIGHMLRGTRKITEWVRGSSSAGFVVEPNAFDPVLRLMSDTGRLRVRRDPRERPVERANWDAGAAWRLRYHVTCASGNKVTLSASLERDGIKMPLHRPDIIHRAGFLIVDQTIARADIEGPFALVMQLRLHGPITVGERELPALIGALTELPRAPAIELEDGLNVREESPDPVPTLTLTRLTGSWRNQFLAALSFDYDGTTVSESRLGATVFDPRGNRLLRRNRDAEVAARAFLKQFGVRAERDWRAGGMTLTVAPNRFEDVLRELTAAHWNVFVDGIAHRTSTSMRASIRSGVDWFDLDVGISFGDIEIPLPRLLEALRDKASRIGLGEKGIGIITDDVRERLAPLLALVSQTRQLKFSRSQTALLDALLSVLPAVEVDKQFERARAELRTFDRVKPVEEPQTFQGELRPYQREALGWFDFLRRFELGGCLADDMGLGKTVQVLALLESRRLAGAGPSLVVVPRSLVFNWKQEAARFTPRLRVLDHTGLGRARNGIALEDENLVITTYGTLRRDITALREIEFDYLILDEAQAIKNATTASAKASRLLRGRHRLALTGTPIENRVEELWSLFEFLNPGMLGAATTFKRLARLRSRALASPAPAPNDPEGLALLARALRPVILRRTKERVSPELPAKVEQTLMVELEPAQRQVYDELLIHYRRSLLAYVDRVGIARSKMKILEALLRLRQAACHPGLISRSPNGDHPSAKLDVLVPKLVESAAEGHKSLVFSQFTSFLALLRERLDAEGIGYSYLDGATTDRQAVVERFQEDAECRLFLISLRAGGHGLNLTAADYVFLLDPWWNPAVEAQAIDRAHRIGQERHVIATRLVARDTIEEKILELQRSKREMADAILSEDQGTLAKIGREELELLLA